jgi:hypothetical protein
MVLRVTYAFVATVLLVHWSTLSQYMVDVPYADDWRQLQPGPHLLPFALDPSWIFLPSNGTVYATSKFFDYLYFTYTTGSYIFHQQLTCLIVLAGCVLLSARLLARVGLPLPWQVLGVLTTVYFLQVKSYWGIAALAYQQALPVLGMLAALVLVTTARWSLWRAAALAFVVVAAGLAYVSGAVAMTALGAFLAVAAFVVRKDERHAEALTASLAAKAVLVLVFGAATLSLQLWLVGNPASGGLRVASPLEWQFWYFWFHQVARALGDLSVDPSSWLRGAAFTGVVFGTTAAAVVRVALRPRDEPRSLTFAIVAGGILVCVASYLAVVSFGRASFPHRFAFPVDLAVAAKSRFHYWWVTALLPWAAVAPYFIMRGVHPRREASRNRLGGWAAPAAVAAMLLSVQSASQWDFGSYYAAKADRRIADLRCLLRGYHEDGPILCRSTLRGQRNLRGHLVAARMHSLHFSHLFEPPEPAELREQMDALRKQKQKQKRRQR